MSLYPVLCRECGILRDCLFTVCACVVMDYLMCQIHVSCHRGDRSPEVGEVTEVWGLVSCVGYTVVTLQWVVFGASSVDIQFGSVYCSGIQCKVQGE